MGIQFSYCGVSFSYTGFNNFRGLLAESIGVMTYAYNDSRHYDAIRELNSLNETPFIKFLLMSDCEGILEPEDCSYIADSIRKAIESWPSDYYRDMAVDLIEGLNHCHVNQIPMNYS